ncbi:YdaU family protein [Erythrobacter sp. GH1-10]|uniref:YdaU family protein n=1 Tax=Erythrobacter sp. GH1-10 TaxID=3349334 RepID=UPI0038779869
MSKDVGIWMPIYVGDYLASTQRLSTVQHGAYFLLRLDYWKNGPPPDDDDILARITRLSIEDWRQIRPTIERFFEVERGQWLSEQLDKELKEARENRKKRQSKARAAAKARWGKESASNSSSNARRTAPNAGGELPQASPSPSPSPSPSTSHQPSTKNSETEARMTEPQRVGDLASKIVDSLGNAQDFEEDLCGKST